MVAMHFGASDKSVQVCHMTMKQFILFYEFAHFTHMFNSAGGLRNLKISNSLHSKGYFPSIELDSTLHPGSTFLAMQSLSSFFSNKLV